MYRIYVQGNYFYFQIGTEDPQPFHKSFILIHKVTATAYTIVYNSRPLEPRNIEFSEIQDENGDAYTSQDVFEQWYETNTGFSAGGGSGRGAVIPRQEHIFDSVTARDTYFTANPGDLETGLPIFVTVSGNVQYQIWGAGAQQTYTAGTDAANWVQAGTFNGTAAQIKALYESNADTNAFTDALLSKLNGIEAGATADQTGAEIVTLIQNENDVNLVDDNELTTVQGLEGVTDNFIPLKNGANNYEDSPLMFDGTNIVSTASLVLPDSSAIIGNWRLSNNGFILGQTELATQKIFFPVIYELQTDGSTAPFSYEFATAAIASVTQATNSNETFSGDLQFTTPVLNTGIALDYRLTSAADTNDCNIQIRANSHTQEPPIFDYKRSNKGVGFNLSTGANTITLPNFLFFETGTTLYVTISSTNTLSLQGETISGQEIPLATANARLATKVEFTSGGGGISGITVQEEGTPLTTEATTLNFVGTNVTASGTGAVKTITITGTGAAGVTVQDEGTDLTTIATTLNFEGAGVVASGNGAVKTITIAGGGAAFAAPSVHNFSINIPSRVDLNTDLNNARTLTYSITNRQSVQSFELIVTTGDNKTLTNPTIDGTQTKNVTLSGISTASTSTLTFVLRITDTQGTTHDSNTVTVSVANAVTHEQTHFGYILSTEDQTDIVFANDDIEARDNFAGDWTVSGIPNDSNLHRIYFAVPTADGSITRISQGGFTLYEDGLSSGNQFTEIQNVTIASQTYNIVLMNAGSAVNNNYNGTRLTVS